MTQATAHESTERSTSGGAALFWRYWTARTVSNLGDAVTAVALPLVAVEALHASSFEVSLLPAAGFLAWIVIGLPAGAIVQRLPLRGAQVTMDLLRAAALVSVPVAAALGVLTLGQLLVVALLVGLATVVFDVGNSTYLPSIVDKEQLTARNSLLSGSVAVTQIGGRSLGGVLVQTLGPAVSMVCDTVSYLVSAALLRTLPRKAGGSSASARPSATELIKDGARYVARHPAIRPCVLAATLVNAVCGAQLALFPVFLVRTVDASTVLVGVLLATEGLGTLLGAALTPRLAKRIGSARTVLWGTSVGAASLLLLPLTTPGAGLVLFAVGNTVFCVGVVAFSVLARTHRQTVTPPELLSCVMATVRFVSWSAIPVGSLAAGLLAASLGNRAALWAVCLFSLLAPLALWASPLRRSRDLT